MKRKIFRTGHSLAVTLPRLLMRDWGVHNGEVVSLKIDNRRQQITIVFSKPRQISLLSWRHEG